MANTGIQVVAGTGNQTMLANPVGQEKMPSDTMGFGRILDRNMRSKFSHDHVHVSKYENRTEFQVKQAENVSTNKVLPSNGKEVQSSLKKMNFMNELPIISESTEQTLETMCSQMKEELASSLKITVEELEKAMEALGVTMMDLFQQNNLQQLFLEVNQVDDMSVLLTDDGLASEFEALCKLVAEQGEILKSLDLTPEEAKSLMAEYDSFMDDAVMKEEKLPMADNDAEVEADEMSQETIQTEVKTESEKEFSSDSRESTKEDKAQTKETKEVHVVVSGNTQVTTETKVTFMDQLAPTSQAKEIVQQIVKEVKVTISKEQTSMEMVLTPDTLGKVGLSVSTKNGVMTAHMLTQTDAAKHAIESQIATLKETLNEQGLKVEAVEVSVAANNSDFMKQSESEHEHHEEHDKVRKAGRKHRLLDGDSEDEIEAIVNEAHEQAEILASVGKGTQINFRA